MKVPFSSAAAVGVSPRSHPTTTAGPALSSLETASTARADHGRCAPTRAHPIPSRVICAARVMTAAGMSPSRLVARNVASLVVGPGVRSCLLDSSPCSLIDAAPDFILGMLPDRLGVVLRLESYSNHPRIAPISPPRRASPRKRRPLRALVI